MIVSMSEEVGDQPNSWWTGPGCVPVSVMKYSDGSVWGIENCGGLEQRVLLGHA